MLAAGATAAGAGLARAGGEALGVPGARGKQPVARARVGARPPRGLEGGVGPRRGRGGVRDEGHVQAPGVADHAGGAPAQLEPGTHCRCVPGGLPHDEADRVRRERGEGRESPAHHVPDGGLRADLLRQHSAAGGLPVQQF